MIFERSAATMRPMSAASRPPPVCPRPISRFTARLRSRWFARCVNSPMAEWMQQLHPLRLQYEMFSNANPMMAPVAAMADQVRKNRRPVAADNPFVAMQETASRQIVAALDAWRRHERDDGGATVLRGVRFADAAGRRRHRSAATRPLRKAGKTRCIRSSCRSGLPSSSRAFRSVGCAKPSSAGSCMSGMARAAVDERGFEAVRRIRRAHGDMPLSAFKALVREQFYMLLIDPEAALAAIPSMLPADAETTAQGIRPHRAGAWCAR